MLGGAVNAIVAAPPFMEIAMGLLTWLLGPSRRKASQGPSVVSSAHMTTDRPWNKSKKKRIHSIGFSDGIINVTWNDSPTVQRYAMTPFRHNDFIDSGEFYLIGRYIEQDPDGFEVKFNNELFAIKPVGEPSVSM